MEDAPALLAAENGTVGNAVIYYAFDNGVNSNRYPYYSYMKDYWSGYGLDTHLDMILAGLRKHDGAVQLTAPVGIAEKVPGDGVAAVHLDDPVAKQLQAVAQVVPEIRFFQQQDDGRGGLFFPQPAVLIGIVRAVGT